MSDTPKRTLRVRIPARTVEVDVDGWDADFGVGTKATDIRVDVVRYFEGLVAAQIETAGLAARDVTP